MRKIFILSGLAIIMFPILGVLASQDMARADNDKAHSMCAALKVSMLECPSRVWPGFFWKDLRVLLVSNKNKTAFLWNEADEGACVSLAYDSVPKGLRKNGWNTGEYQGKQAVSLADQGYGSEALILLVHEGFHILGQKGWKRQDDSVRGTLYPEDWRPRYLRRQIMTSLERAFVKNDQKALGEAAYWQKKYALEYPQDLLQNKYTDLIEGSAEYVGLRGATVGIKGCQASEAKICDYLRKRVGELWQKKWNNYKYKATIREGESYAIGAIAGCLLDAQGAMNWKEKVIEGYAPMGLLAESVAPIETADNKTILKQTKSYYERKNSEMKKLLDNYQRESLSREYFSLALPLDWLAGGTFEKEGMFNVREADKTLQYIIGMSADFVSPDGASRIKIKKEFVRFGDSLYPFGGGGFVIVPLKNATLKQNLDGSFSISATRVKAWTFSADISEDTNGKRWVWVKKGVLE
ncbi:MAG: hypothetical protein KJ880_06715 [Candidatus Omnitrophica bacterium]|nr:hypothetical protein [Candidatus Omnitrophota bacterium]MBU1870229.1 hypothetical protein [Candidatus Omnitrophota bacterium]